MNCILENIRKSGFYRETLGNINNGCLPERLLRLSEGLTEHFVNAVFEDTGRTVFFVFPNDFEAKKAFEASIYVDRIYLPSCDAEISYVDTRSTDITSARTFALSRLIKKACIVYTSIEAMLYKMRPKDRFEDNFFTLREGMIIEPKELQRRFSEAGYEYSAMVEGKGQFSGRGEITEVFVPADDLPLRITFFDDEIETIRRFDTDTQRSLGDRIAEAEISPAYEISLNESDRKELAAYFGQFKEGRQADAALRNIYELEDSGTVSNISAYADVFSEKCCVTDWVEDPLIILRDLNRITAEQASREETSGTLFAEVLGNEAAFGCENSILYHMEEFLRRNAGRMIDMAGLVNAPFNVKTAEITCSVSSSVGFLNNMDMLAEAVSERMKAGWEIYLFAASRGRALKSLLEERGIKASLTDGSSAGAGINIVSARISAGFSIDDVKAYYLSETDIFGRKLKARSEKKKKTAPLDLVADLKAGDTVVHEAYGKGRYLGVRNMEVGGTRADYLEIEYRDGDKLFIKTSQIDKISQFVGSDEDAARLSKLGGKEWEGAKTKARNSIKKLTEDLVSIYEERANTEGYSFSPDTAWQNQFEDNFEYEETPGQIESTEQIKRDMQSRRVMDRLLLGDVGYGKTEVAMRAAFKAVMDSKQVAVLVPTTMLARQHYRTFLERFAGFPVRIAVLTRFTKDTKKVIENINSGQIDIIIGTHKLLSKSIRYRDLGLLIVDEEQRFGVSHKERIKDMKRTVDVLTLTATPIPRTLEMAMTGIRDISTIDTPPEERKEVASYVAEFSWSMVREACMREMARGGQIYFVCRRISQMDELLRMLNTVVPEARCAIAHGQMGEEVFESVINAFYDRQFDILLCTTIIESGIDIQNVNTIIIYEADMFGLAQLYQLKGRVGRSSLRAYAYFTYLRTDSMNETARKRLEAIREFTQFGSGYKIAMRDLEIRGAGNILGPEQSGHMAQIGYNLYCKIVRQEVDSLLKRPEPFHIDTEVDLGLDAFIPESYITDEAQKLDMYRAVLGIKTLDDLREIRDMMYERYGTAPKQAENLLVYRLLRSNAERAGIASIIRRDGMIEMKFADADRIYVSASAVRKTLEKHPGTAQFRPSVPPAVLVKPGRNYVNEMLRILAELRRCIKVVDKV